MSDSNEPLFPVPGWNAGSSSPPPESAQQPYPVLHQPSPRPPNQFPVKPVLGIAALLLVCAIAFVAVRQFSGNDDEKSSATASSGSSGNFSIDEGVNVSRCSDLPEATATRTRTDPDGLFVTLRITSSCDDGDVLSSNRLRIAVRDKTTDVASGYFDLSRSPIAVPPNDGSAGASAFTQDFRFPADAIWQMPSTGQADFAVDISDEGSSSASSGQLRNSNAAIQAAAAAPPRTGNADEAALRALRAQAEADRADVRNRLADRWIPQVSSKQVGLFADGIRWDNAAILREHMALRLRYPDVRLLWSGDWSTFTLRDWWVTVVGVTFPDGDAAVGWCHGNGFDHDHCFGKLVSLTHPIDGSTKLW